MDDATRVRLGILFNALLFIAAMIMLGKSSENPLWFVGFLLTFGAEQAIYGAQLTFTDYYYDLWMAHGKRINDYPENKNARSTRLNKAFEKSMTEESWRRYYRRVVGPGALALGIWMFYLAIKSLIELHIL